MEATRTATPLPTGRRAGLHQRLLVFTLEGERLGIESRYTRGVIGLGELTPIPRAPRFVIGLTLLRGEILAVADVRELLGLPGRPGQGRYALIVEAGDVRVGLCADEIHGFEPHVAGTESRLAASMRDEIRTYGKSLVQRPDGLVLVLNLPVLIEALEAALAPVAGPERREHPLLEDSLR